MISAIIGGAAALGSSILGAVSSAKHNKEARKLIEQQKEENRAWYNSKMASDYTQRTDAQALLTKQRQLLDEQYKGARATNAVAGGTDQSVAMQQKAANDAMAQTTSDIAANAAAEKDRVEQQYRQTKSQLDQQDAQLEQQQAQNIANAASQVVSTGVNMVGAGLAQGTGTKASIAAGKAKMADVAAKVDPNWTPKIKA